MPPRRAHLCVEMCPQSTSGWMEIDEQGGGKSRREAGCGEEEERGRHSIIEIHSCSPRRNRMTFIYFTAGPLVRFISFSLNLDVLSLLFKQNLEKQLRKTSHLPLKWTNFSCSYCFFSPYCHTCFIVYMFLSVVDVLMLFFNCCNE